MNHTFNSEIPYCKTHIFRRYCQFFPILRNGLLFQGLKFVPPRIRYLTICHEKIGKRATINQSIGCSSIKGLPVIKSINNGEIYPNQSRQNTNFLTEITITYPPKVDPRLLYKFSLK